MFVVDGACTDFDNCLAIVFSDLITEVHTVQLIGCLVLCSGGGWMDGGRDLSTHNSHVILVENIEPCNDWLDVDGLCGDIDVVISGNWFCTCGGDRCGQGTLVDVAHSNANLMLWPFLLTSLLTSSMFIGLLVRVFQNSGSPWCCSPLRVLSMREVGNSQGYIWIKTRVPKRQKISGILISEINVRIQYFFNLYTN